MALGFIPLTIGALAGVRHDDAGVASGLVNTGQQIGGAIGVAAATTIAATSTSNYLGAHPGVLPTSGAALTHGFAMAFYALAGVAALGAVLAAVVIESAPPVAVGRGRPGRGARPGGGRIGQAARRSRQGRGPSLERGWVPPHR